MPVPNNNTAVILIIGNEILSGKTIDTNSSFIANELSNIGISIENIITVKKIMADTWKNFTISLEKKKKKMISKKIKVIADVFNARKTTGLSMPEFRLFILFLLCRIE